MSALVAVNYSQPTDGYGYPWTTAFADGLKKHGFKIQVESHRFPETGKAVPNADLHVFWGLRIGSVMKHCRKTGQPFICLDHGYTEDRRDFTSINLYHLNGKSQLDVSQFQDDSSRCLQHGWHIKDSPQQRGNKIIVIGQVHDDRSLETTDIYHWAKLQAAKLEAAGHRGNVLFKPHPLEKTVAINRKHEVGVPIFEGSMEDAFKIAKLFYTYASTVGPSAWLNGMSAYAASPVSMIYKDQFNENTPQNRQKWLNKISFTQYNVEEMADGTAWALLGDKIIGKKPKKQPPMSLLLPANDNELVHGAEAVAQMHYLVAHQKYPKAQYKP